MNSLSDSAAIWERDTDGAWVTEHEMQDELNADAEFIREQERLDFLADLVFCRAQGYVRDEHPVLLGTPHRLYNFEWLDAARRAMNELCDNVSDVRAVKRRLIQREMERTAKLPNPFEHDELVRRGEAIIARGVPRVTRPVRQVDLSQFPASA